jgi:hypothetical protein
MKQQQQEDQQAARTNHNDQVFYAEAEHNITETKDMVKELVIASQEPNLVTYSLTTLEGDRYLVEFVGGVGYQVAGDSLYYENVQALLSAVSGKYREAFASAVSRRLMELTTTR